MLKLSVAILLYRIKVLHSTLMPFPKDTYMISIITNTKDIAFVCSKCSKKELTKQKL